MYKNHQHFVYGLYTLFDQSFVYLLKQTETEAIISIILLAFIVPHSEVQNLHSLGNIIEEQLQ